MDNKSKTNTSTNTDNFDEKLKKLSLKIDDIQKQNFINSESGNLNITVDATPTQNSQNAVSSGGVFSALATKQDALTAGNNITISNGTISATNTTYTAGSNITIDQNNVISASVDTSSLQSQITANATDIGHLQQQAAANTSNIVSLQNNKQNKLTAGTGIAISEQNVISATGGSGLSEVTASDVNSESATNGQVLTADGNGNASWTTVSTGLLSVQDGNIDSESATSGQVLTADGQGGASWQTASGGGSCDLTNIENEISAIKLKIAKLHGLYDDAKINEDPFTPYDNSLVVQNYDVYERELDITKTGTAETILPNIMFHTLNTGTATIDLTIKFKMIDNADTATIKVFDESTQIDTFTISCNSSQLNTEQTVTHQIANYSCTKNGHNFYLTSFLSSQDTTIVFTNIKFEVTAPNAVALNKIEPYDVEFNYYTNTYYITNCTNGSAKICEINANDLEKTSDIVWTDLGFDAQNVKVAFVPKLDENNEYVVGDKFYIIMEKNCKLRLYCPATNRSYYAEMNSRTGSIMNVKDQYAYVATSCQLKNSFMSLYQKYSRSMYSSNSTTLSGDGMEAVFETCRIYSNYFDYDPSQRISNILHYDGKNQIRFSTGTNVKNIGIKNGLFPKLYLNSYTSLGYRTYNYYFRYYGKFVKYQLTENNYNLTCTPVGYIGTYDDYFQGANNDYFCVKNGQLFYYKNEGF